MRVSRETSLGSSLHRASTDALILHIPTVLVSLSFFVYKTQLQISYPLCMCALPLSKNALNFHSSTTNCLL